MNQRAKFATKGIDINTKTGLELGPLTMPTVKKDNGIKIFYLDHMSTENLKKKYKDEPINPDDIVKVDYVMNGTIKNSVKKKKFDYVIASHVIEHIPNTVAWFREIEEVLNKDGYLSLVIPDKRFTFDIFREVSRPTSVIGAYIDKVTRFSSAMVYDAAVNYVKDIDSPSIWRDPDYYRKVPPEHRWSEKEALELAKRSAAGEYIDTHCYVYTPVSFLEIIKALIRADLINFTVERFASTPENEIEFYVILKKISGFTKETKHKEISKINRLIRQNAEIPTHEVQIKELENERDVLKSQLNLITSSLMWRLAKPIRHSKHIMTRVYTRPKS